MTALTLIHDREHDEETLDGLEALQDLFFDCIVALDIDSDHILHRSLISGTASYNCKVPNLRHGQALGLSIRRRRYIFDHLEHCFRSYGRTNLNPLIGI